MNNFENNSMETINLSEAISSNEQLQNPIEKLEEPVNEFVSSLHVKSLGNMCFRYAIHFSILSLLVDFAMPFIGSFILSLLKTLFGASISNNSVVMLIYAVGYSFLGYYFLTWLSLRDTFLKGRCLDASKKKGFMIFALLIVPILNLLLSYLILETTPTLAHHIAYIVSCLTCILATWLNRKYIVVA